MAHFRSLRFVLILVICLGCSTLWIDYHSQPVIKQTNRELDLAIVGEGYFRVTDFETGDEYFTRCGKLKINEEGTLGIEAQNQFWMIDPYISLPQEYDKFSIDTHGNVHAYTRNSSWVSVGQIQLVRFAGTEIVADPCAINPIEEQAGAPTAFTPGEYGGTLQQGWIETSSFEFKALLKPLILAIFAAVVIELLIQSCFIRQATSIDASKEITTE